MDLFEHQAKGIFAEHGVPVPEGRVALTPAEARAIAEAFAAAGKPRVVVKAQVKTGGRGKAGGVKRAGEAEIEVVEQVETMDDAARRAAELAAAAATGA